MADGLKERGDDWDLLRHALPEGHSAFKGTTQLVTFPDGNGAASWVDEGGYVYELCCVPSWDVSRHTQGRRLSCRIWRYRAARATPTTLPSASMSTQSLPACRPSTLRGTAASS